MCTSFAPALRNSWTTRPIVFPRTMESSISTTRFPRILSSTAESLIFTLSSLALSGRDESSADIFVFDQTDTVWNLDS